MQRAQFHCDKKGEAMCVNPCFAAIDDGLPNGGAQR